MAISICAYGCLLIGWVCGYFWGKYAFVYGGLAAGAVALAIYLIWKYVVEPHIDAEAKVRIQHMRGGQGEGLIAWLLEDLDDYWHVFNGLKLRPESDIDHILVGPGGLYCISTKSHRGLFEGTSHGLLHNGQKCDFAQQALRQAMELKDYLESNLKTELRWVQAVLAVPFGYTERDACGGKVLLVHQENIVDRLMPESGPKELTSDQIDQIVKVLDIVRYRNAKLDNSPEATASPNRRAPPQ